MHSRHHRSVFGFAHFLPDSGLLSLSSSLVVARTTTFVYTILRIYIYIYIIYATYYIRNLI